MRSHRRGRHPHAAETALPCLSAISGRSRAGTGGLPHEETMKRGSLCRRLAPCVAERSLRASRRRAGTPCLAERSLRAFRRRAGTGGLPSRCGSRGSLCRRLAPCVGERLLGASEPPFPPDGRASPWRWPPWRHAHGRSLRKAILTNA